MKHLNLDTEDKRFLKEEMIQASLMCLIILIVASIVVAGLILALEKAEFGLNRIWVISVASLTYLGFLVYTFTARVKELTKGLKGVSTGLIADKKQQTNYSWSGGISDFTTQPKITEFFFTIDNQDVWVDEKYYKEFNVNDRIDIHFSLRTGSILKVTKEE